MSTPRRGSFFELDGLSVSTLARSFLFLLDVFELFVFQLSADAKQWHTKHTPGTL